MDYNKLEHYLSRVREFRNRVYHNEPVCFEEMKANFSNAENVRRDIYELLEWINPELPVYVGSFDTINHNINSFIAKQDGR
jgi:hypothetical protein